MKKACDESQAFLIVEAAGIEPASRDISATASTCVVSSLVLARQAPTDTVLSEPAEDFV